MKGKTMKLPKLAYPTFDLTIPSTQAKIRFRPFLVKEEKLLLIAKQSGEGSDILNAIKQVIVNCDVESKLNPNKIASFDLEYLFLKLRGKSINNVIDLVYLDSEDEKEYKFSINIDEIEIQRSPEHSNIIKITEKSGIVMGYPTSDLMGKLVTLEKETDILFTMINGCIETYYEGDKVYKLKECTPEEINEFVEGLPTSVLQDIEKFFDTMPKLHTVIKYKNSKGTERTIELKTLEDFFTLR